MVLDWYVYFKYKRMEQLNIRTILISPQNTYVIESVLGHGTFGITYTVRVTKGKEKGKRFALKEFFINGVSSREESGSVSSHSDTILTEQCKAEFIAEAKNLIALNHPNIVKAHEVFEANGTVYYTMDYIEGENLNGYLSHNSLSVDEVVKIITKIAYALSYMHESQHMLHLDLKPGNVMRRSSDGQIILIDFGLSRYFTKEDMPEGESPIGLGTKGYAPIEQSEYTNRKGNFKATIDVYALGATFYKLVTGESPMPAKALASQPHFLDQKLRTKGLPEDKIKIIEKAMNPTPEKRYQSVMSFIYDINTEERKRRKKGLQLSLLILIGILVIGAITFKTIQNHKEANIYKEQKVYAFELRDFRNGANHYGEMEYYKFFSDGTGLYLFESWHDPMDCKDPECDLVSRTDTAQFKYDIKNGNMLFFKTSPKGFSSSYDMVVKLLPEEQTIYIDENKYPLQVNTESINWTEVSKMLNKEWTKKQR